MDFFVVERSSGFQLTSTHKPCTGPWSWSTLLKRTILDEPKYNLFTTVEGEYELRFKNILKT